MNKALAKIAALGTSAFLSIALTACTEPNSASAEPFEDISSSSEEGTPNSSEDSKKAESSSSETSKRTNPKVHPQPLRRAHPKKRIHLPACQFPPKHSSLPAASQNHPQAKNPRSWSPPQVHLPIPATAKRTSSPRSEPRHGWPKT